MIKPNEVRIGNLVMYDGRMFKIHTIAPVFPTLDTEEFGIGVVDWNNIEPVPLTEELLVMFGFEKSLLEESNADEGYYYSLRLSEYVYTIDLAFLSGGEHGYNEAYLFPYDSIRIKYAHQLQNLYFALAGEELEIN